MARSISEKRKQFMNTLLTTYKKLDPTGENAKIYEEKFSKMSDKQFDTYIKKFFEDDKRNFYFELVEYEREIKLENIEAAANYLKVPLYERVVVPYLNGDDENCIVSPTPVPVGYIHIKRLPQRVLSKNHMGTSIAHRSSKTGTVTGHDRNGRETDVENYSMNAYGAYNTIAEFLGPRADDQHKKDQMYAQIELNGTCYASELQSNPDDKVAINTLDTYYAAAGFCTNLVRGGWLLSYPENQR
jgi:hypothetical protein